MRARPRLRGKSIFVLFALTFAINGQAAPASAPQIKEQAKPVTPKSADQAKRDKERDVSGLPIAQWLKEGERQDIAWKVEASRATLTYQLRPMVRITATVAGAELQRKSLQRDLKFIVRAATPAGQWFEGESVAPFRLEKPVDRHTEFLMIAELYLAPGQYKLAAIVYDAVTSERNLTFIDVAVPEMPTDGPPAAADAAVDFLAPPDKEAAPIGSPVVVKPQARKPLRLRFIVDVSMRNELNPEPSPLRYSMLRDSLHYIVMKPLPEPTYLSRLLEAATVLGDMRPPGGCERMAMIETSRRRELTGMVPAEKFPWGEAREELFGAEHAVLDARNLRAADVTPQFFAEEMQRLLAAPPCETHGKDAEDVVIFLSRGLTFPRSARKQKLSAGCACKVYYFRMKDEGTRSGDDLKGTLDVLHPKVMEFDDATGFAKRLKEFVRDLQR